MVWVGGLHNLYQRVRYICVTDAYSFFGFFSFSLFLFSFQGTGNTNRAATNNYNIVSILRSLQVFLGLLWFPSGL